MSQPSLWMGVALVAVLAAANLVFVARLLLAKSERTSRPMPGPGSPRTRRPPPSRGGASGVTVHASEEVRALDRDAPAVLQGPSDGAGRGRLALRSAARSDKGLRRLANEDAVLEDCGAAWFAVADGLGGHSGGDVASRAALDALARSLGSEPAFAPIEGLPAAASALVRAVWDANDAVRAAAGERGEEMGTTLVAARFDVDAQLVYVVSVGDSRCDWIRGGRAEGVTRDHVSRRGSEKGRGALDRALGLMARPPVDVHVVPARPGDRLVLSSDGLWTHVPPERLAALCRAGGNPEAVARTLVAEAVRRGSRDDVSVVVVYVSDADE